MSSIGETFDTPMTAHLLGGCTLGDSPESGVIDPYHRVYGRPGLHIVDRSAITANLGRQPGPHHHRPGVSPAERAIALWPDNGEQDPTTTPRRRLPQSDLHPAPPPGRFRARTGSTPTRDHTPSGRR
jgi:cholesterol oxidase